MDNESIERYYAGGIERSRLEQDYFLIEALRTKEIISRYLSGKALSILDIGGGTGYYAFWLQLLGHRVSLIDLSKENVTWAQEYSKANNLNLEHCTVGNALHLDFVDDSFDIALMLGPQYHLINKQDRVKALTEAKRILKPDGVLICAYISRYASLLDGFRRNLIQDKDFVTILRQDLASGIHRNLTSNHEYFTTAYFHSVEEIRKELNEAELVEYKVIAVEGPGWLLDEVGNKLNNPAFKDTLFSILDEVETEEQVIPFSPHIISISRKKEASSLDLKWK